MRRFLTIDIHPCFAIDIMSFWIDFITIPWANTMDNQNHMDKKQNLFYNPNIYNNMTRFLTVDFHPHFTMDIIKLKIDCHS